jgi:hypothetical protein
MSILERQRSIYKTSKPNHPGQLTLKDIKNLPYNTELTWNHPSGVTHIQFMEIEFVQKHGWKVYFRYEDGKRDSRKLDSLGAARVLKKGSSSRAGKYLQNGWITLKE